MVSNRKDPERLAIVGETHDSLSRALAALAERERNIIALKFGAGLKNTEIARVTGVTEDNVGVILYRTLKKLKKELGSVSAYEPEEGRQSIF
ncbi:MAG: subfamily polymerase sigma-24 subunit [Paenibacillaceae bacterium]|nr:subfamily polymerase sigma-24 subunit [Paenibacillaceae bacterium]